MFNSKPGAPQLPLQASARPPMGAPTQATAPPMPVMPAQAQGRPMMDTMPVQAQGTPQAFKAGGAVKRRGDGIATRGKTKGRFC